MVENLLFQIKIVDVGLEKGALVLHTYEGQNCLLNAANFFFNLIPRIFDSFRPCNHYYTVVKEKWPYIFICTAGQISEV